MTLDRNPETMPKSINIVYLETEKKRYSKKKKGGGYFKFFMSINFCKQRTKFNLFFFCFIDKNKDKVLLVETTHWQSNHTILL